MMVNVSSLCLLATLTAVDSSAMLVARIVPLMMMFVVLKCATVYVKKSWWI